MKKALSFAVLFVALISQMDVRAQSNENGVPEEIEQKLESNPLTTIPVDSTADSRREDILSKSKIKSNN